MSSRYELYQEKVDEKILTESISSSGIFTGTFTIARPSGGGSSLSGQYITNPSGADPNLIIYSSFTRTPGQSGTISRVVYYNKTIAIYWGSSTSNVVVTGPGCVGYQNLTAVISGPTRYYTLIYVGDPTQSITVTINQ